MPISYPPLDAAWYLTGPTASGKTAVADQLASHIGGEILSLDSMAVYRGMDIGTAKPVSRRRDPAGVATTHLIDLVDAWDDFSLADYVAAAHYATEQVAARGLVPLFVGGTPLYLKALLRGLFVGPQPDWDLRRRLQETARTAGGQALVERLAKVDPVAAARLHANDVRRLIRALEVFELTGQPITDHQKQFDRARPASECRVFVLDWPRDELYARIDRRVDEMFAAGWVEEVRRLQAAERPLSRTASQAVGYREILEHLAGGHDLATTIQRVKTRTRQFAKRQLTWFRSLSECRWMPISARDTPAGIAQRIALTVCGTTV
jgi:tRNA dimethylallyltransferase